MNRVRNRERLAALGFSLSLFLAIGQPLFAMDEAYKSGLDLLQKMDCKRAIVQFTNSINKEPTAKAYAKRGEANYSCGFMSKAMSDYNSAIKLDPKNLDAYYGRSRLYSTKKNFDGAIKDLSKALNISPNYIEALGDRGMLYKEKGNLEAAVDDFSKAVVLGPKHRWPYVQRGLIYMDMNKHDEAIADFEQIVKLDPKNSDSYEMRGKAYEKKGDYKKALEDFSEVIKLSPDYAGGYVCRSRVYEKLEGKDSGNAKADRELAKKHGA